MKSAIESHEFRTKYRNQTFQESGNIGSILPCKTKRSIQQLNFPVIKRGI